ncbi:MAG: hypothetical protein NBV77_06695 [Bacteroidia bacterium]|nr:hypothetical protein [Bacteroidia bacterium]
MLQAKRKKSMQDLTLIEILTAPKTERCECLPCVTTLYAQRLESVRERESEAMELLNDDRLGERVKNGSAKVDFHAKSRFSILMNVVSDPIVKIKAVKKLILDESFDLDLLDVKTFNYYNNSSRFESIIRRQFGLYSYGTLMKNALVYRRFPELMEQRMLSFEREKVVAYAKAIAALGYNFYKDFFGDCPQKEKIQITSVLFDQFLSNGHENLIRPIQELFALITNLEGSELVDELPKAYTELANRILMEGNHECLPFKTRNYGAKSLSEYLQISQKNNRVKERLSEMRKRQNQKIEAVNKELSVHLSNMRKLEERVNNLQNQLEKNIKFERKMRHFNEMSDLSPLERLKFIIQSEQTIYYYPHFALENIREEVDLLSDEDRSKLLEKLQIVNRGPLRDLKNYLNCNK